MFRFLFPIFFLFFSFAAVQAEVRLPNCFSDRMVLQREQVVPVWGWADPGEEVTLSLGPKQVQTTADASGEWRAELGQMLAGGPYEMVVRGSNEIRFTDVLVGEVWMCAGQSNMERSVALEWDGEKEVVTTTYPTIRLFKTGQALAGKPREEMRGSWTVAEPAQTQEFSALGFYFGRHLRNELDVPIGLIQCTWDGSSLYAWSPRATIEEVWKPKHIERVEQDLVESASAMEVYRQSFNLWVEAAADAEAKGEALPAPPEMPRDWRYDQGTLCRLWNGMVAPWVPYGIRGVIWHQGEADANRSVFSLGLFPALIRGWRAAWGQGDFPFLFVQLNNFLSETSGEQHSRWAEFREEQARGLSEPNTAMVVTLDIGDPHNIHPKNKKEVAKRLALAALGSVYGKEAPVSGPRYREMKIEEESIIRVYFDHAESGLGIRGEGPIRGFEVAGQDRQFKPAAAKIEGEEVLVRSPEVPLPVAVRYGWADNPDVNLYNKKGLPAAPFRSDDWPGAVRDMR
jgi:sialate O-acetylesterase